MTLSDILDGGFRLYRSNFLTLLGIVAVLQVPMIVFRLILTVVLGQRFTSDLIQLMRELPRFGPQQDSFSGLRLGGIALFFIVSLVLTLMQGLVVQLVQGALASAVADRYLGRPVSIGGAYRVLLWHLGALLGAAVLLGLIGIIAIGLFGGVSVGVFFLIASMARSASGGQSGALTAILLILVLLFAFVVMIIGLAALLVRFMFFTQAVVVENQGVVESLRRSWQLVRGSYWRVFGIVLLVTLLSYIVAGLPATLAGILIQFVYSNPVNDFAIRQSLTSAVSYGAQILVLPIQLIAYTLLYYDLRIRKEGYDLQLLAEQSSWQ